MAKVPNGSIIALLSKAPNPALACLHTNRGTAALLTKEAVEVAEVTLVGRAGCELTRN